MPDEPERRELHAAPPFWTWRILYIVVVVALAAEIAVFIAVTLISR
jgi:hypothetical protein